MKAVSNRCHHVSSTLIQRTLPILFYLIIYSFLTSAYAANSPECKSETNDKSKSVTFLCAVNVTFLRQLDCSADITEQYVFPHTTGRDFERGISAINEVQKVTDIYVHRDGKNITHSFAKAESDNEVRISVPTVKSAEPAVFHISYRLSNAVFKFSRSCKNLDAKPKQGENANIMRWRSGEWDKSFNTLSVSFLNNNSKARLRILSSGFNVKKTYRGNTTVAAKNVDDLVEVYAKEWGTKTCTIDLKCFGKKEEKLSWLAIMAIVFASISLAFGALKIIIMVCSCIFECEACSICGEMECDVEPCLEILELCGLCCGGGDA
ncbi:hypothetical protein BWQ96_04446 [Gracilariopsis chorda]|uniref:Uncharacterized protein n=1 Tax=Gracilariopsis chorda TaxID=448386 RepID=A0A2V3IUM1_9FLOR|nr:hypothetical protein BWQ96_04446 [Gracilariopsis chorda]|eukprot:PXF45779.1 hypothetical protein BWQ96_04446 [Gracilariopsis chorda]